MLDFEDQRQIIDFGLAKKMTPTVRKKWKGEPNVKVTLFMMKKGLRKYGIHV